MKRLCIYHNADLDGKCAAAIVLRATPSDVAIDLHGINYGDQFPWSKVTARTHVLMVDYSLQPFSEMQRLHTRCGKLTWIDHHKSAIDTYARQSQRWDAILDTRLAACELTWHHCFGHAPMPEAVRLLGRYDVWQWQNQPDALPFQYGMRGLSNLPEASIWDALLQDTQPVHLHSIISNGHTILGYIKRQDRIYAKTTSFPMEWHGLRFVCANAQLTNSSLFDAVWDPARYDAMLTFGYRKGKWHVSLYAPTDAVDLSAIAKEYGGGGHAGAAGFQCGALPFTLPVH